MTAQLGLPGIRTCRRIRPADSTEFDLQCALITWAKLNERRYPDLKLLHAIPNGGFRHIHVAVGMKKSGVRAGIPDLCLPSPRPPYAGLYLELKSPQGRLSSAQRWWHHQLAAQGYGVRVARSLEEGIAILETYLSEGSP